MRVSNAVCSVLAALLWLAVCTQAFAQALPPTRTLDENGVDLGKGEFILSFEEASIGSGAARLPLVRVGLGEKPSQWDELHFHHRVRLFEGTSTATISLPGQIQDRLTRPLPDGPYDPEFKYGETLKVGTNGWEYSVADGSKVYFDFQPSGSNLCSSQIIDTCPLPPSRIVHPNGNTVTYTHAIYYTTNNGVADWRIASISNSFGYSIEFAYQTGGTGGASAPPAGWFTRTSATFKKNGVTQFTINYAYPAANTVDITDAAGGTWRVTPTSIRRPGESSPSFTVTGSPVTSVTRDGVTTSYARTTRPAVTTVTNALSQQTVYTFNSTLNRPTSIKDALNRTTTYQYDTDGRLTRVTQPEGNTLEYSVDGRGNVTQTRAVSKTPGTPPDIVTSATFPATCTNQLTCNKPTTTTDAKGKVTDYTYDSSHGGILTVTSPAPASGAVRPQTRYSYNQVGGIWQLTGTSACATLSSCVGGADEVKATFGWDTSGNLTSASSGNGTGSLTATRTMTYDARGDLLTVNGPLSGRADTTRFRYDAARRRVGTIGPDPDAGGSLKHRAVRTTYDLAGRPTKQEVGTVDSQSDPDWAAFAALETVDITYDSSSRLKTRKLSGGGTAFALTQLSYDALGRLDCSATRMNPAQFGSLPASACTLDTQGSFGRDRISKTVYDAAGQVTQLKVAVGTSDAANERTLTYTDNGRLQTLKDAENNLTTYEYDGFDRLSKTRFPNTPKGSGTSSTTDYEQLTYDANSNVTSRRLRDATSILFTYDALNRPTLKNLPGTETTETYAYDNVSRLTLASKGSVDTSFAYDALSRATSTTSFLSSTLNTTTGYQYDLAGRRTRLTYPDGLYLDYDYLVTGEMTKIRENGAASGIGVLATYAYDNLGRRTSLTFGNGTSQSYAYDPVSRLSSLTANLAGTSNDLTIGSIAYSPASQIVSLNRSNDSYAFTPSNESTPSVANGLNQLASIGGNATAHDARGNLTSDPATGNAYTYTAENQLLSGPGSIALRYDGLGRLRQLTGAGTQRFAYDGLEMIAEYNGADAVQRRYVFGPGVDEPLVQYEGSGTTDRRFLHADERGSIVAISDASGSVLAKNSYDEFGRPGASNSGRFQYTGQAWLPEVGLYHYKARAYAPHLGRFLQTDPVEYAGGMNLYAYVGNDPVNFTDPLGLDGEEIIVCGNCWSYYTPANAANAALLTASSTTATTLPECGSPGADPINCEITVTGNRLKPGTPRPLTTPPIILPAVAQCGASFTPVALTPHGDTKGENPRFGRGGYLTDLPGGYFSAMAVFVGLSRLAGDVQWDEGPLLRPDILRVSRPSGIQFRVGKDLRFRIDIPGNTFDLSVRETVHFTGGKGNMCPIR